jgi:hypothetical protein
VLAVVEHALAAHNLARATAQLLRALVDRRAQSAPRKRYGCGHAGVAAADNGDRAMRCAFRYGGLPFERSG